MHLMYKRLRKNIARNSRLIRDDDDGNFRLVQLTNGCSGEWKNLQPVHVIDVAHFFANRAVTVQKCCPSKQVCLRHSDCSAAWNLSQHFEGAARLKRQSSHRYVSCSDGPPGKFAENRDCKKRARELE